MSIAWGIFEVYIFTLGLMVLVLAADRSRAKFHNIMCISCALDKGQCGQCCCFVVCFWGCCHSCCCFCCYILCLMTSYLIYTLDVGFSVHWYTVHGYKLHEQRLICGRRRDYFLNHHVYTSSEATWAIYKVNNVLPSFLCFVVYFMMSLSQTA
jgi:hypothetical protein